MITILLDNKPYLTLNPLMSDLELDESILKTLSYSFKQLSSINWVVFNEGTRFTVIEDLSGLKASVCAYGGVDKVTAEVFEIINQVLDKALNDKGSNNYNGLI